MGTALSKESEDILAKLLNLPPRIKKLRNKEAERSEALDKLKVYRQKKAAKKKKARRRGREEKESKASLENKDVGNHSYLDRKKHHKTREG